MGCSQSQEGLEAQLLVYKLNKYDIQQQREELLREYLLLTGEVLHRKRIPDYIDHKRLIKLKQQQELRAKEEEEAKQKEAQMKKEEEQQKQQEKDAELHDALSNYS